MVTIIDFPTAAAYCEAIGRWKHGVFIHRDMLNAMAYLLATDFVPAKDCAVFFRRDTCELCICTHAEMKQHLKGFAAMNYKAKTTIESPGHMAVTTSTGGAVQKWSFKLMCFAPSGGCEAPDPLMIALCDKHMGVLAYCIPQLLESE